MQRVVHRRTADSFDSTTPLGGRPHSVMEVVRATVEKQVVMRGREAEPVPGR